MVAGGGYAACLIFLSFFLTHGKVAAKRATSKMIYISWAVSSEVEQRTFNPLAAGSIPARPTNNSSAGEILRSLRPEWRCGRGSAEEIDQRNQPEARNSPFITYFLCWIFWRPTHLS
jgi:hypothetical protein